MRKMARLWLAHRNESFTGISGCDPGGLWGSSAALIEHRGLRRSTIGERMTAGSCRRLDQGERRAQAQVVCEQAAIALAPPTG
jgi:hypothetical protein